MKNNQVVILSDAIRTGKTTALQEWTKRTSNVAGFLSPVVNGTRMFLDIETGSLLPMETQHKDLAVGKYVFDSTSFQQVEKRIKGLWKAADIDYIVIDEIGPLEINKDLGFHELLMHLQKETSENKPKLFFIVRDICLDAFLKKYNFKNIKVMSLAQFRIDYS